MTYVPQQGDIIYLDFNPQAGHEQMGRRPGLVISNDVYNKRTGLAIVCPITNTDRGFPLHIKLNDKTQTTGVIMCEQMKALDFNKRHASFIEISPDYILDEVLDIVQSFFDN